MYNISPNVDRGVSHEDTKGGLKKLREALRAWKKKEGYLQNDRTKLEQEIAAFQRLPIPSSDDRDAYAEY